MGLLEGRCEWHVESRNGKVGDICLLKDSNSLRGEWKLVKVSETYPDERGVVRNVQVTVPRKSDGSLPYKPVKASKLDRHVNNLIVLVPVDAEED